MMKLESRENQAEGPGKQAFTHIFQQTVVLGVRALVYGLNYGLFTPDAAFSSLPLTSYPHSFC